jgi:hypothetical protein
MKENVYHLDQKYEFEVSIAFNSEKYHFGTLKLTQTEITIQFSCEYNLPDAENFKSLYADVKCYSNDEHFLLINLNRIEAHEGILDYSERYFYKASYSVQYVIINDSPFVNSNMIASFSVSSSDINRWIGNTNKQEEILQTYETAISKPFKRTEFIRQITLKNTLMCSYTVSFFHDSPNYKGGIIFPPRISFGYSSNTDISSLIKDIHRFIDIFSFIIGKRLFIDAIRINLSISFGQNKKAYLYFCYSQGQNIATDVVFFPLGTDLRIKLENIPEFPLNLFDRYFMLSEYYQNLLRRFLNAREMIIGEEKFLAVFRLAEKLSFEKKEYFPEDVNNKILTITKDYLKSNGYKSKDVSSYLKRLKKVNESKYNTEATLIKTFSLIKEFIPEDANINESVGKMVKLRNDITHANEYHPDEMKLGIFINLLDVLVTYLFLKNVLGVMDDIITLILPRHKQLRRIFVPKIYYSSKNDDKKEKNGSEKMDS